MEIQSEAAKRPQGASLAWKILIVVAAIALLLVGLGFLAGGAARLDCGESAETAKHMSIGNPPRIRTIVDIAEISRTRGSKGEACCSGTAQLDDGRTRPIHMRAFESDGKLMVEYSPTAFG